MNGRRVMKRAMGTVAATLALAAVLCPAARAWDNVEDLKGSAESAYAGSLSFGAPRPVSSAGKEGVVLEPTQPAKTKLTEEELAKLLAVAESVFKSSPKGLAIGNINVHRLLLNGAYRRGDGSLSLESIVLRREFFHGNHDGNGTVFEFTVLPDRRISKATRGQALLGLDDLPLEQKDVQEVLRGELDFWLDGDGWRKAMAEGRNQGSDATRKLGAKEAGHE